MSLAGKFFKGDRVIWVIFLTLGLISLIEVFSATSTLVYKEGNYWGPIIRHSAFLFVGLILTLVILNCPYKLFPVFALCLPVSIGLLVATLVSGVEINDSSRWISLFGFRFQPSEIAKLSCIVYVSWCLSRRDILTDKQRFYWALIGVLIVCALIFPENFSTSIILFFVCFLMIFISWVSPKRIAYLFVALLLAGATFFVLLHTLPDEMVTKYDIMAKVKHRTEGMFEAKPPLDAKTYKLDDYNRQETFAKIAIANGGLGKMPGHGQQRDMLPQAYSDFIYAIIIEEMGVVVGLLVLVLYLWLMLRVGTIAHKCETLFPKYLVLGCGLLIVVQALANMAVVVGLFPVTGQPLPLVSRGGTSTIITCICFGMILSVDRFGSKKDNEEEEEEEDDNADVFTIETDMPGTTPLAAAQTLTNTNV
jgi:cell division protein FtsW